MCDIYRWLLNLPTTIATNFLICSKVSLRKFQAKGDSKINTLTPQTLHLLHFFQQYTARIFLDLGTCDKVGYDVVDKATEQDPD